MPRKPTGGRNGRPPKTVPPTGTKPELPDNIWRALELEVEYDRAPPTVRSMRSRVQCFSAPLALVAMVADVSPMAISKRRRNDPAYLRGWEWLVIEFLSLDFEDKRPVNHEPPGWHSWPAHKQRLYVRRWIRDHWQELVEREGDHPYSMPETYANHLLQTGGVPWR